MISRLFDGLRSHWLWRGFGELANFGQSPPPLFRRGDKVELLAPAPNRVGVWLPCGSTGTVLHMYADNRGVEIDLQRPVADVVFANAKAVRLAPSNTPHT